MKIIKAVLSCSIIINIVFSICLAVEPPKLILAETLSDNFQIQDYWVSEKLDGVRAYWDGKQLISRQGNVFNAPDEFINKLPKDIELDGELWMGRGQFETTQSIVSRKKADWSEVYYMLFEAPHGEGDFSARYALLRKVEQEINSPQIKAITQYEFNDKASFLAHFKDMVAKGAEGLMLHRKTALYSTGRSSDLLKLKPYIDEEATVIGHIAGKGKFLGMLGSVQVVNKAGIKFKIGSGFSNNDRQNPPEIGSQITYRYQNLTQKGKPRHPRFLRRYQAI